MTDLTTYTCAQLTELFPEERDLLKPNKAESLVKTWMSRSETAKTDFKCSYHTAENFAVAAWNTLYSGSLFLPLSLPKPSGEFVGWIASYEATNEATMSSERMRRPTICPSLTQTVLFLCSHKKLLINYKKYFILDWLSNDPAEEKRKCIQLNIFIWCLLLTLFVRIFLSLIPLNNIAPG